MASCICWLWLYCLLSSEKKSRWDRGKKSSAKRRCTKFCGEPNVLWHLSFSAHSIWQRFYFPDDAGEIRHMLTMVTDQVVTCL